MGRVSAKVPIRKLAATDDVYNRGFHKGDPGGLDAVDTDLAAGNIKDGETIFGKLGTFAGGPLVEDVLGRAEDPVLTNTSGTYYRRSRVITSGGTLDLATTTPTFAAGSRAVGVAWATGYGAVAIVIRLIMGGVQVATSFAIGERNEQAVGSRALSGAQACICRLYNPPAISRNWMTYGRSASMESSGGIGVGSIKI